MPREAAIAAIAAIAAAPPLPVSSRPLGPTVRAALHMVGAPATVAANSAIGAVSFANHARPHVCGSGYRPLPFNTATFTRLSPLSLQQCDGALQPVCRQPACLFSASPSGLTLLVWVTHRIPRGDHFDSRAQRVGPARSQACLRFASGLPHVCLTSASGGKPPAGPRGRFQLRRQSAFLPPSGTMTSPVGLRASTSAALPAVQCGAVVHRHQGGLRSPATRLTDWFQPGHRGAE